MINYIVSNLGKAIYATGNPTPAERNDLIKYGFEFFYNTTNGEQFWCLMDQDAVNTFKENNGEIPKECCSTCKNMMKLEKYDYSHGGCEHSEYEGYACLCFINEGVVVHMVGSNPNVEMCEMYSRKIR